MDKQHATIEVIAPTIEEAVKNGLTDLGLNRRGCRCRDTRRRQPGIIWSWIPPGPRSSVGKISF